MSRDYTDAQLTRMVEGVPEEPNVVFYEQSKMNPDESKAAGKRVYHTRTMIKKTQPGVTDWAAYVAQREDIAKYPKEYQLFLATRADVGSPSIDIIPGITPDEQQELIDYGMLTVTKLCEANTVPAHLEHVRASARRISSILKQEQHANEQSHEQEANEESHSEETSDVPSPNRQQHSRDVIQPSIQGSGRAGSGETKEGVRESGCEYHRQGLSPNWSIQIG